MGTPIKHLVPCDGEQTLVTFDCIYKIVVKRDCPTYRKSFPLVEEMVKMLGIRFTPESIIECNK